MQVLNAWSSHGFPVVPPVAQYLFPGRVGQVIVAHDVSCGVHVELQSHDDEQSRLPHAPRLVQVSVHLPAPQFITLQAAVPPPQDALHAPVWQVMSWQAFEPVHIAVTAPLVDVMS